MKNWKREPKKLQLTIIKLYTLNVKEMRQVIGGGHTVPEGPKVKKTLSNFSCASGIDDCGGYSNNC